LPEELVFLLSVVIVEIITRKERDATRAGFPIARAASGTPIGASLPVKKKIVLRLLAYVNARVGRR
jgi:hypothetical protein